jgi:hypothetical protein
MMGDNKYIGILETESAKGFFRAISNDGNR